MRTLKRKLSTSANAKVYGHVIAALYNRCTEPSARDLVMKVINIAASPEKAKYIRDN